jgi:hydroxymethylbilane synthase
VPRSDRKASGRSAVLVTAATPGDGSTAPIERLGTTGVFTSTLREALLRGDVDLVVHSGQDLPTAYRDCRSRRSRPGRTRATR